MELSREVLTQLFESKLTEQDVELLNTYGHDEATIALLATEHAGRQQALLRCLAPEFAAKLGIIIANVLVKDARHAQDQAVVHG